MKNKILEAVNNFYEREYYSCVDLEAAIKSDVIALAYTTGDNGEDINVLYDIKNECYINMVDGKITSKSPCSINAFIYDMNVCDFNMIISDAINDCEVLEND